MTAVYDDLADVMAAAFLCDLEGPGRPGGRIVLDYIVASGAHPAMSAYASGQTLPSPVWEDLPHVIATASVLESVRDLLGRLLAKADGRPSPFTVPEAEAWADALIAGTAALRGRRETWKDVLESVRSAYLSMEGAAKELDLIGAYPFSTNAAGPDDVLNGAADLFDASADLFFVRSGRDGE